MRAVILVIGLLALVVTSTQALISSVDLEAVRQDVAGIAEDADDEPLFSVSTLRYLDAQVRQLTARLAAGRISRAEAARERLSLARQRTSLTRQTSLTRSRGTDPRNPVVP